ncbi:hypothetical protein [Actinotalea sp. JY-7876]|uniref:hypothetical protein n=1 Tax=Actinotalea sp. JY-7876 TaxID=2758442 RepID=UPI0015F3E436|nr:hypothetical protein [Actinotalea sp. JY-7876]
MADARNHLVPASGETPRRQAIADLSLSINDVIIVANTTERAQKVADLGVSRPLVFFRLDAPSGRELEYTRDAETFHTVGEKPSLTVRQAAPAVRPANQWSQAPVNVTGVAPAIVSALGPQPWEHENGVITILEDGEYEFWLTLSMSASNFTVQLYRLADSKVLGQSPSSSGASFSNQAFANPRFYEAGDQIVGRVYPAAQQTLVPDSNTAPCILTVKRW